MSVSGTVISVFRGGCAVVFDEQIHELTLTGSSAVQALVLAVGDEVTFDPDRGVVESQAPRRTELARLRPQAGRQRRTGGAKKVLAANMDAVAIVMSVVDPPFRSGAVDRFWLAAVEGGLEAILIVNKVDRVGQGELPDIVEAYKSVLPVFETSAKGGQGLAELAQGLRGKRTVFAGHSGVGKSSLLNSLQPELRLATGEVSSKTGKGRHTTTAAQWLRLPGGAIVVDTPGVREIATGSLDEDALEQVYPDIEALAHECRFRDCRHDTEPDCAVANAVAEGSLHPGRLESFAKLREEIAALASEARRT